jgi:hypothetical protein
MVITLEWTPQRLVWIALVVSAIAIVLCIVLAAMPARRRRERRGEPVAVPAGPTGIYRPRRHVAVAGVDGSVGAGSSMRADPEAPGGFDEPAPVLSSPLRSWGARPGWITTALVTVAVGGFTSAIISPAAGLPVALATLLALVVGYGRVFLVVGAVGLLVAVDRMVTTAQGTFRYVAEFGWPNHFETAGTLAWFAVAALGADALVQEMRARRGRRLSRPDESARPGTGSRQRRGRRGKHLRTG